MDFAVSIALAILAAGMLLNAFEFTQKNASENAALTGKSDLVAEMVVTGGAPGKAFSNYCVAYSNNTNTCAGFSCTPPAFNTVSTRRIVACPQGTCVAEVKTCA